MPNFYLSPHTHFCELTDGIVFLDLKHHRYFGLSSNHARGLKSCVADWPADENTSVPAQMLAEGESKVMDALCEKGLLTRTAVTAKPQRRSAMPERAIDVYEIADSRLRVRPNHVINFIAASTIAFVKLRFLSMDRLVRHLERRNSNTAFDATSGGEKRLRELVLLFRRVRLWIYTPADACLHDSLSLVEFLNRYGIASTWVIGVSMKPFRAHCWSQRGAVVLNDSVEHVHEFTPILTV